MKKAPTQQNNEQQESLGQRLQNTRIARGLTLENIAEETKISGSNLRAMEADNHQALPAKVFTRSFYVQYATLLDLDPDEIVTQFLKENNHLSEELGISMNQRVEETDSMTKPKGVFLASRIGLAILLLITLASGICWQRSINPAIYLSEKLRSFEMIKDSDTTISSSSS